MKKTITFRRLVSLLVALVFVFSIMPNTLAVEEGNTSIGPDAGEITITKAATAISDAMDNRVFEITLTAQGAPLITDNPIDIVLVLDTSYSMSYEMGSETRLQAVKRESQDFVNNVMDNNPNARVELVAYAGDEPEGHYEWSWRFPFYIWVEDKDDEDDAWTVPGNLASADYWSREAAVLNTSIEGLTASGGTNIQAGFMKAKELLDSKQRDSQKIVVLMSDGEPTYYYDDEGVTQGPGNASSDETKSKAIAAANSIKTAYPDSFIYTVGFGDADISVLQESYKTQYFSAANAAQLKAAYDAIAQETYGVIATDAVITDTINEDFTLVDGSISDNGSYDDTDRSITWEIGEISSVPTKVSFKVKANDDLYAAAFTNDSAYLDFKPIPQNTFYSNLETDSAGYKKLTYNKPVVPVAPIAKDDPDSGVFSVITGEELAGNVHSNDPSNTKHEGTGYDYSDKLFRVNSKPDDNGTLTLKDDGTFTYISTAGFVGEYIFTYDIYTYVPQIDYKTASSEFLGAELFDTAKVIINVLPKPTYSLTVVYEDQDTGLPLTPATDPNKDKSYIAGADYTVEQVEIDGYDYVGPKGEDKLTGKMPADNVTVTLLFKKEATPPTDPTPTTQTPTPTTATPTPTPMITITPIGTIDPLASNETSSETTEESIEEPTTVPTIKVEPQETPQAGEKAPLWPIGLALLLMAGGLAYILHHKSEEEKDQ